MTSDFLIRVAKELGIPVAFVAILCGAIWYTGTWSANHVIDPLIKGHVEFLKDEQENMGQIAKAVDRQTTLLREIRDDQRKFPAVAEKRP